MAKKTFLKSVGAYKELHVDEKTGLAWVEDGSSGNGHSAHPNIAVTGSIRGMKKLGYWAAGDRIKRSHGFFYNIDKLVVTDQLDEIARAACRCGGKH